jgi:rfaE bifunctional protein kinase chain/domain
MDAARFRTIVDQYPALRVAVLGDFCLDRYLEIDPAKSEVSLETALPVHNVVNVRAQPGGAGTIVNNLAALGIGAIYPIGFAGQDGDGFDLWHALDRRAGVRLGFFVRTAQRRTFTYCKPLLMAPGKLPLELNRIDFKNWTPTPALLQGLLLDRLVRAAKLVDAIIVLDQADLPETGVVTKRILAAIEELVIKANPELLILADSRRGLRGFPPLVFKMNAAELSAFGRPSAGTGPEPDLDKVADVALGIAQQNRRAVFVTLAEHGIIAAAPGGETDYVPALPVRGEIDIVGAGDAVSANLTAAMAADATMRESIELAAAAASVVIHKLGTTGTATVCELEEKLRQERWLIGEPN